MKFLDAHALLAEQPGGEPLPCLLALSGSPGMLPIFMSALCAQRGRSAQIRTLPFNTLAQHLLSKQKEQEIYLLLPWDLAPACDWRSGIPARDRELSSVIEEARVTASQFKDRGGALFYLPAPIPPLFSAPGANEHLAIELAAIAHEAGAHGLPPRYFSLQNYLASGIPFDSEPLGDIASSLVDHLLPPEGGYKVLVTDLDNVMWHGVIGEDGIDGIHYRSEGVGFRHFIYQTLLARLRREGVLLAAVSRNDEDLARAPFVSGKMVLRDEDLAVLLASYQPKSAQIQALASRLGLGLNAFVFVDDNPVELAEVEKTLPQVKSLPFPAEEKHFPLFFDALSHLFAREKITDEDRQRTELYRRRLAGMAPQSAIQDMGSFLRTLEMSLTIAERAQGDRARAVQLINKTNQFNLNGRRFGDEEIAQILEQGGRLFVASLSDRHGAHGEILACLMDGEGVIRAFVMSCRVLERRVEHAFLAWLARSPMPPRSLAFVKTERNAPLQQFLQDPAFFAEGDRIRFDARMFADAHGADLSLFVVSVS